uniref:Uncharacterized protein n=1 Tax=Anguilla anguilla TaxID=7936 RepID=A0A0E9UXD1_ANGAN
MFHEFNSSSPLGLGKRLYLSVPLESGALSRAASLF